MCKDSTKTVGALIYKGFYGFVFETYKITKSNDVGDEAELKK